MSDQLRRLLADLAGESPAVVDVSAIKRAAVRRQTAFLAAAAVALATAGVGAAAFLSGSGTERLETSPVADRPKVTAAPDPSPTPKPPASPGASPDATAPAAASAQPESQEPAGSPGPNAVPPSPGREGVAGLPEQIIAADGSRVATYRTSDGARTSWLSPSESGFGISRLAMSRTAVLYGIGSAQTDTHDVRLVVHPARADSGPARLGDPGTFMPAVLDDTSRYAFLATGDDGAYNPRSPQDLRLVLHEADAGVQAATLDPEWLLGGLSFASPDRIVLSIARSSDRGLHGLQLFDFQTDEAQLGSRAPDTRFLSPPAGCSWTLPTAAPVPDQVLVLEKCERSDGGDSNAVTVDINSGQRLGVFATVRPAGPGQVDSLDLDATGKHLIAQVHSGDDPAADGTGSGQNGSGERTVSVGDGRTVTTTERLISPVWQ
jgi:hypothetical protein